MALLLALLFESAYYIALGGGAVLLGLALRGATEPVFILKPSILIAATCALQYAFTTAIAVSAYDTDWEASYLPYPVPEHFAQAVAIGIVGSLAMWWGARLVEKPKRVGEGPQTPWTISFSLPSNRVRPLLAKALVFCLVVNMILPLVSFGAFGDVFRLGPLLITFLWGRTLDLDRRDGWLFFYALVLIGALNAFLFSVLRIEILMPVVFALFGLLSVHGPRCMRSIRLLPFAGIFLVFILVFSVLGVIRSTVSGTDRIGAVSEGLRTKTAEDNLTFLGRLSPVCQLTQIVQITEAEGFYEGETLEYLTYVFIPRLLWADKPMIAKGQWFARKIGQGQELVSGSFSNSINMTVPGELYLNFGWLGVITGCLLIGTLYGFVFASCNSQPNDVLGGAMGIYVLWLSATTGADLQIGVTLVAIYLLMLASTYALSGISARASRAVGPAWRPGISGTGPGGPLRAPRHAHDQERLLPASRPENP